jgi:two-component system phosphate regulon response regulator PhoB
MLKIEQFCDIRVGDYSINAERLRAYRKSEPLDMGPQEFRLLHLFMANCGDCLSREAIASVIFTKADVNLRSVDVYVARLRSKVADKRIKNPISTIPGAGYVFTP